MEEVQLGGLTSLFLMAFLGAAIYFAVYRLGLLKGVVVQGVQVDSLADALATEVNAQTKAQLAGIKKMNLVEAADPILAGVDKEASAMVNTIMDHSLVQEMSQKWEFESALNQAMGALQGSAISARAMLDVDECHEGDGLLADCDDNDRADGQNEWYKQQLDFSQCPQPASEDLFKPLDNSEDLQVLPAASSEAPLIFDEIPTTTVESEDLLLSEIITNSSEACQIGEEDLI